MYYYEQGWELLGKVGKISHLNKMFENLFYLSMIDGSI